MDYFVRDQADFDRYRCAAFTAGDRVLLAEGYQFRGQFTPTGCGERGLPIRLGAFCPRSGQVIDGPAETKPVIHGLGGAEATIRLHNPSFWEVENIEVTNTDGSASDQGNLFGIRVVGEDAGLLEHVHIRHCLVHDVNALVGGKWRGGIHVDVVGDKQRTWFDDVRIEGNIVKDVGGVGVSSTSTWKAIGSAAWTPWTNVIVRNNWVERTGRNGIIIRVSEGPLIEHNTLAHNSRADVGHSVLTFDTRNAVMQYNEAYGNTGSLDDTDRGGFDADFKCENTIIQYNYSHGNHWFCGIMRKYNRNVTIRYNVSINELLGAYLYGFPAEVGLENVQVHDNIHYFGEGLKASIFPSPRLMRTPINTCFRDNVFIFASPGEWGVDPDPSCEFEGNTFLNVPPLGSSAGTDTCQVLSRLCGISSKLLRAGVPVPAGLKGVIAAKSEG